MGILMLRLTCGMSCLVQTGHRVRECSRLGKAFSDLLGYCPNSRRLRSWCGSITEHILSVILLIVCSISYYRQRPPCFERRNLASYTRRQRSSHHRRLDGAVNVVAHTTHLRVRVLGIVARRLGSRASVGVGGGLSLVFMLPDSGATAHIWMRASRMYVTCRYRGRVVVGSRPPVLVNTVIAPAAVPRSPASHSHAGPPASRSPRPHQVRNDH